MQCARATEVALYVNNIYSARVPMHFLVAHGYETPALITQPVCDDSTYALTIGSTVILASADVSSLLMRQKPTRSTVSNRHHTLAFTDVLVRPTAAVDFTSPT